MPTSKDNFEEGFEEVKNIFWGPGKVGDKIKGTLIGTHQVNSRLPGHEGEKQNVYEVKVLSGEYHKTDESTKQPVEPVINLKPESIVMVGGRKSIDQAMKQIKIGQMFAVKYIEEVKSKTKGFNPTKVCKVYMGAMDSAYLEAESVDVNEVL